MITLYHGSNVEIGLSGERVLQEKGSQLLRRIVLMNVCLKILLCK